MKQYAWIAAERADDMPHVRAYEPADLDACIAVFDSNVPHYFIDDEREPFREFLQNLPGPYFVIEDDEGRVIACGGYAIVPENGQADLCWGMVRYELHRRGIGRLLTEARVDAMKSDPRARCLALNTSQHTTAFYERLGFEITEVIPNGIAAGLDRCEMRLFLTSQ